MSDERKETLTHEVAGDHDIVLVTVAGYNEPVIRGRLAPNLDVEEFPQHRYWLNRSGMAAIQWNLGDDPERWIGSMVPLLRVKTRNPTTGAEVTKLHVAPAAQWRRYIRQALGSQDETDDLPL